MGTTGTTPAEEAGARASKEESAAHRVQRALRREGWAEGEEGDEE